MKKQRPHVSLRSAIVMPKGTRKKKAAVAAKRKTIKGTRKKKAAVAAKRKTIKRQEQVAEGASSTRMTYPLDEFRDADRQMVDEWNGRLLNALQAVERAQLTIDHICSQMQNYVMRGTPVGSVSTPPPGMGPSTMVVQPRRAATAANDDDVSFASNYPPMRQSDLKRDDAGDDAEDDAISIASSYAYDNMPSPSLSGRVAGDGAGDGAGAGAGGVQASSASAFSPLRRNASASAFDAGDAEADDGPLADVSELRRNLPATSPSRTRTAAENNK